MVATPCYSTKERYFNANPVPLPAPRAFFSIFSRFSLKKRKIIKLLNVALYINGLFALTT